LELLQQDLRAEPPLAGGGDDQCGRSCILYRNADGLVEGDLVPGSSSWSRAGDELAQLGVYVIGGDDAVVDGMSRSLLPAGNAASTARRDSTQTRASTIVASSTSRPARLYPTEVTWTPGDSHERRITGSVAWVVAHAMSAPSSASSLVDAARTCTCGISESSAASADVFAVSRPATRICVIGRTRHTARACDRAWTPVPSTASTVASSLARSRADNAEHAPVRMAVIAVPSSNASGSPVSGENVRITAWCVASGPFALCGKRVTSLLIRIRDDGT